MTLFDATLLFASDEARGLAPEHFGTNSTLEDAHRSLSQIGVQRAGDPMVYDIPDPDPRLRAEVRIHLRHIEIPLRGRPVPPPVGFDRAPRPL